MLRRLSAAISMLLLLQLSLQAGIAACGPEGSQNDAVASVMQTAGTLTMGMSADMPMDMPMDSQPPCGDTQGPLSCDGPYTPTSCAAMVVCHVAMTVSSALNDDISIERPVLNFAAVPPLPDSATVPPQPPPPRA